VKLSDAAKILNTPVRELIDRMTKAVPETTWKADTILPSEFVEQLNVHSQEYQQVGLPKQEAQNAIEAVGESKLVLESLDYAILESLADERTYQLLVESAHQAVDDYQQAKTVYSEIIAQLATEDINILQERRKAFDTKISQGAILRSKTLGELQGRLTVQSHSLLTTRQSSQDLKNQILQAALGHQL
jgi:hypothetical protein